MLVSLCLYSPFRDYIVDQLGKDVTQATIHQRLRDELGLTASLASLKRWVAANLPEEVKRRRVTVLGGDAVPGEQAQIDYGMLGTWIDPKTQERHRVWAFVMVLACSRMMFVRPVLRMDRQAWTQAHVEAFSFFGGVPARLVPDNLKTGVERPDLYDPKINRSYAELAEHYDTLIDPARAAKPKDKPQVERPMPYVRDSFWRGREFTSIEQMQAAAVTWSREVAGRRHCRPLDGAAPGSVFAAVEAETLRPLPARPFVLATWSTAKVGPDIHIKAGKTLYSVPWRHIGHQVDVPSTASTVQVFHHNQLITTHAFKPRGKQTDEAHYPREKIAFRMRTPVWCRTRAAEIGPGCVAVVDELLADGYDADPGGDRRAGDGGAAAFLHGPGTLFEHLQAHPEQYENVVALSTPSAQPVAAVGNAGGARRDHAPGEPPARSRPADDGPGHQPGSPSAPRGEAS